MTSSKDAREEEEPARQDHLWQQGSHFSETGWKKMNADRSYVGRIVREAAVTTYKRIRLPEFRPKLEQRQKRECGKDNGTNTHFEPHRHRDGPSCCPVTSSCWRFNGVLCTAKKKYLFFLAVHNTPLDFWVVLKQEVDKEGWNPKMKRFEKKDWELS